VPQTRHIYTPANVLSGVRFVAAPICAYAICSSHWHAAGLLFILAVATDLLDGPVARKRGDVSPLGGLIDHTSDAFFCTTILGALALKGLVPAALPFLVAGAFLQYAADSKIISGQFLRTSIIGRYNGIAYFVLAGILIIQHAMEWGGPSNTMTFTIGWVLIITTLVSMVDRLRALLTKNTGP
jgi:phosphatidylglycerophosphate synthase